MQKETLVKNAIIDALDYIRSQVKVPIDEFKEFAIEINEAFTYELLSGNPNAQQNLEARTKHLLEQTRVKALQTKKQAVLASVVTAAKIVQTILVTL